MTTVLFDMDGVLVDTEGVKCRAHAETIARFGGSFPLDVYPLWMGRSHHDAQAAFAAAAGILVDEAEYSATFGAVYGELLRAGVETTPGAIELLDALREEGCALALVTSSLRWMVEELFRQSELGDRFHAVVCAEDVAREKPAPDAYLRALELMGEQAQRAVVVEDTDVGLAAGLAAGCRAIGVRHRYNARHSFPGAATVLHGLAPTTVALAAIRAAARG